MKLFLALALLMTVASAQAQEEIYIGTLTQGKPTEVKIYKSKKGVTLYVANIIEWDDENDEDVVKKTISGLKLNKRVLTYNGKTIGKKKFLPKSNLGSFLNENQAYIKTVSERYCTDAIDGDCLSARTRYHVYLVIL